MKVTGIVSLVIGACTLVAAGFITNNLYEGDAWVPFAAFAVAGVLAIMVTAVIVDEFGDQLIVYGGFGLILSVVSAVVAVIASWIAPPRQPVTSATRA